MAGQSGGPWGGGGNSGGGNGSGGDNRGNGGNRGGRRPPEGSSQIPEIDELMKKGQDQLRVLMGGRGGGGGTNGTGGGSGGPGLTRGTVFIGLLIAVGMWLFASFYTVKPEERAVELFLGEYHRTTGSGAHLAPWPFITYEKVAVTSERNEDIGVGVRGSEAGLMLTGDENIVDIDFQVVWNINDPAKYLFNLRDPRMTIRAVSESAMREIIAQSQLAPILNRDRGVIASRLEELIQSTLDSYDSGVDVIRVNFDKADPPQQVIDAFREVQAAEQQRDRLEKEADAYAARVLAQARGEAAQTLEEAEGYRARVVNEAEGEASRFSAVLTEYQKAPEITRKRLYLEAMEEVLGDMDKIILDENQGGGGQGIVPYLPLNELRRNSGEQ
ncbi:FtsH protease activity modulator HflK [Pseudohalocynthiibacter aestuariivivens]|uniref:Protein HflK n=1 Tax=Roseovarius pelagicus TaxID=2980108 RepID=A0ABY6DAH7_9RHOB|nr:MULTISPECIES: FtsH protease activity modulator HflK [Rhodobacterales]QIE44943.1 FtsH protease activity modulator HflK [Pseudohalocynthiibacter aestuariivivens]UXX83141.1 FtsH protease activity modulator HflK [Roseovarius pelagicus]